MTKARSPHVPTSHRVPAHLARRFHQVCLGITAEITGRVGLTPVEYSVLTALDDTPNIDQGSLAARLGVDTASAHHLAQRLEAAGYVERRIDSNDRRARALRLAPRGKALREKLRPGAHASQERILAPLARKDRRLFLDMLARLVEAHEAYARPGNGRRRVLPPEATSSARPVRPPAN